MTAHDSKSKVSKASRPPTTGKARATKKDQLIQMLSRKSGADVTAISKEFGWLPHTTRAALTGLRKSGYVLVSEKPGNGKPSRYRITAEPCTGSA